MTPDTNVGTGIVPHKSNCQCNECTIDNLLSDKRQLEFALTASENYVAAVEKKLLDALDHIAMIENQLNGSEE